MEKENLVPEQRASEKIEKLLTDYRKCYPKNKVFHVTSDMQVFLEADRNMAVLHQNSLKSGQLTTIK